MLNLDGLEMIAVLVVMGLFIKVLEQFGMFEPVGGEGKGPFLSGICLSKWSYGVVKTEFRGSVDV